MFRGSLQSFSYLCKANIFSQLVKPRFKLRFIKFKQQRYPHTDLDPELLSATNFTESQILYIDIREVLAC